jgi:lipopolysaccharide transport protein LptA
MRGRAASGRFATQTRVLTLAGPVTGEGDPGAPFDSLSARAAEYRENEGVATFAGDVRAARGGDTLACDTLAVRFGAENRVESAAADGHVSGTLVSGDQRAAWTAAAARSSFDADGQPARVELTGRPAALTAPAAGGQPERRVTAPRIVLGLRAGRIASADAEGGARLERTVAAADGSPSIEWIEGDTASAAFAAGTIASVRFDGNVRGRSADGESRSPAASYSAATSATSFLGTAESDAELLSPRGRILGRRIDVDQASGLVTATGDARAMLPPGTATASAPSFVASAKAPTRARADRIVLDDRRRTAVLTGRAALWQGDDSVMADRIELHDADRTAVAEGSVRVAGRTAGEGSPKENARIAVSADTMHWKDAARTGTFEGNVSAARGQQTARGDRGECRVDADGRIERTVLDGDVSFADRETGRSGRGERAVDDPKAGVTNLAGDPAVAQDAQGNRVQGAVLTFRKQSGSVEVKAKEGGRVESVYQTHGS